MFIFIISVRFPLKVASSSVSKASSMHLRGEWVNYFRTKVEQPVTQPRLAYLKCKRLLSFTGELALSMSLVHLLVHGGRRQHTSFCPHSEQLN